MPMAMKLITVASSKVRMSKRLPGLISNVQTVVIADGLHVIAWTHAGQVTSALLQFLA